MGILLWVPIFALGSRTPLPPKVCKVRTDKGLGIKVWSRFREQNTEILRFAQNDLNEINHMGLGVVSRPFFFSGKWLIASRLRVWREVFCLTRKLLGFLTVRPRIRVEGRGLRTGNGWCGFKARAMAWVGELWRWECGGPSSRPLAVRQRGTPLRIGPALEVLVARVNACPSV